MQVVYVTKRDNAVLDAEGALTSDPNDWAIFTDYNLAMDLAAEFDAECIVTLEIYEKRIHNMPVRTDEGVVPADPSYNVPLNPDIDLSQVPL